MALSVSQRGEMSEWLSAFAASTSAQRATADKSPLRRDISPWLALHSAASAGG